MLTGKPPFQSTTADEIYRRAREREYDWPKLDTSENFISQETKDLVADLLQSAELRPSPDMIVQHPFFTCGWVPQPEEMGPELREHHPSPDRFRTVGLRGGRSTLFQRNLKKLAITCDVGPWSAAAKPPVSTYREVAAEEKAGLTPAVPLPAGIVYRRFDEWKNEQAKLLNERDEEVAIAMPPTRRIPISRPSSREKEPASMPSRPPTQSFAAQQRARPQGIIGGSSLKHSIEPELSEKPARAPLALPARHRSTSTKVSKIAADVEDRLAVDLVNQLGTLEKESKSTTAEISTATRRVPLERNAGQQDDISVKRDRKVTPIDANTITLSTPPSLFHPREKLENLSNSTPDQILHSLRRLLVEMNRALRSETIASQPKTPYQSPPVVVKWVDYTNRFGLGYILSNGDVGCVIKSLPAHHSDPNQGSLPSGMLMIREAELHVRSGKNENYPDRFQIVPVNGPNIEFYESRADKGIFRGTVNPQNYKVVVDGAGKAVKLSRGVDRWDDRKRERIVVWKKFANYMTTFGRDLDYPGDPVATSNGGDTGKELMSKGNIVIFYQRFGDVGVWAYLEGHLQVSLTISISRKPPY